MPNPTEQKLIEIAKKLLQEGTVEQVIGYRAGPRSYQVQPHFARTPEEADQFILSPFCSQNLVRHLRDRASKVAIVVKGCDSRAINALIAENQLDRDQVYVIGVPCTGLVDVDKLAKKVDLREVKEVHVEGDEVVVVTSAGEPRFPAEDLLEDCCLRCQYPNPVVADEILGEEVPPRNPDGEDPELDALEEMSPAEREEFFRRAFSRCIRCYACVRNCPLCYCTTCFAVQNSPQWLPRIVGTDENQMFNLGRALHLAGRCVQCGACDRACPVNLPLRLLNAKMAREVKELFDHVAGLDPEKEPPLTVFQTEDVDPAEK